jgi:hypothetical protein
MRNKKVAILIAAVVVILGVGSASAIGWQRHEQQHTIQQVQSTRTLTYQGENGQTALALLKMHAYQVVIKNSSYGPFVETIDGVKGGTDGKYWLFFVNGKEANVGAGAFKTKNGEIIAWKFQ